MKKKEIMSLAAAVIGAGAGLGVHYLLPKAHDGFCLFVGVFVFAAAYRAFRDEAIKERLADNLDKDY